MAGETTLTLVGNLTGDPELRFTESGVAVVNFAVATNPRVWSRAEERWQDGEPLFLRCTAWRALAEHVAQSLSKGARVVLTGHLEARSWTDKEGRDRTSWEVQVEEIGPSLRFATAQLTRTPRAAAPVLAQAWSALSPV